LRHPSPPLSPDTGLSFGDEGQALGNLLSGSVGLWITERGRGATCRLTSTTMQVLSAVVALCPADTEQEVRVATTLDSREDRRLQERGTRK
jgi:hypothetical protein